MLNSLLHMDRYIGQIINDHGTATYLILFAVIFCETGLVITPFLPGDSLLFAVGIFCHPGKSILNVGLVFLVILAAAFFGDTSNYFIGMFFGHRLFKNENSKIFKKSYLDTTHEFFEKHGRNTVVLARFVPIVRTFAPCVAGLSDMPYVRFIGFSLLGTTLWVSLFLFSGYFLGTLPAVKDHFSIAVVVMVIVTAAPLLWEVWKSHVENQAKKALAKDSGQSPKP